MLTFTECVALRDAGFPQADTVRVYWNSKPEDMNYLDLRNRAVEFVGVNPFTPLLACPNTDELLAEIERRWPDDGSVYGLRLEQADIGTDNYEPGWAAWAEGWTLPSDCCAPCPASALCALYIRLSQQPTPVAESREQKEGADA